jgi:thiol-disulfide isomerase/thioredoxin
MCWVGLYLASNLLPVRYSNLKFNRMKKVHFVLILVFFDACFSDNMEHSDLPSFNLLLTDSTTIFNSSKIPEGKPIILLYFNPDCEHCQKETKDILDHIELFKNIQFYFVTNDQFDRLKLFESYYQLRKYPNIMLGRDYQFQFLKYYKNVVTPYLAIYDKRKQLRVVFGGGTNSKRIVEAVQDFN